MSKIFTDQEVIKELIFRKFDFQTNAFPPRDITNPPKFSDLTDEELVSTASERGFIEVETNAFPPRDITNPPKKD